MQRIYALNDEPAVLVCDYGKGTRPQSPFPYYAEAWTGIEYLFGAQLMFAGMVREGIQCFENVRRRFDGERRNPWDEPECGHHYARAMSAWSGVLALSGFSYHAAEKSAVAAPRLHAPVFSSFWSAASGWGKFTLTAENGRTRLRLAVIEGTLPLRQLTVAAKPSGQSTLTVGGQAIRHQVKTISAGACATFAEEIAVRSGTEVVLLV